MDNMIVIVPLLVIGVICLQLVLRFINKATINKTIEKDWQAKQQALKEAAERRKQLGNVGGTKFKDKLYDNPNDKKWDKLKQNPKMAKKRL